MIDVEKVAALVAEGQSLAAIGRQMGVSREYIRQICLRRDIQRPPRVVAVNFPISGFKFAMRRWLLDCGYLLCQKCGQVKPCKEWHPGAVNKMGVYCRAGYCRACSSERQVAYYHASEKYRAYQIEYHKQHPEYKTRWMRKNPEKLAEYRRKRYLKIVSTPEGRERMRQQNTGAAKSYYSRQMSTDDGRAKLAARARASRERRKQAGGATNERA